MEKYTLAAYKGLLTQLNLLVDAEYASSEEEYVTDITFNSKEVTPGTLFICKGLNFKEAYLKEAIERGAIGYVSEEKYPSGADISEFIVTDVRVAMPQIADLYFDSPSKKLHLIGVGGTKGKTTTTHYVKGIIDAYMEEQGKKPCGMLSSIITYDGLTNAAATNTTPEAIELQRHLANAVEAGLEYMVIEVSSQALKYNRVDCIELNVGIFLNIAEDHISPLEHKDFEDYFNSKMMMFDQTKIAVVNQDAAEFENVLPHAQKAEELYTYSREIQSADYYGYAIESNILGTKFRVKSEQFDEDFELTMPGSFNVENALAAIGATDALGIPYKYAQKGLINVKVAGHMETWTSNDDLITIFVDYAHNKLSFETLYPALREDYPEHYIIGVFGAPGGKARNRRQELGSIAGKYADEVILTMEDPDIERLEDINAVLGKHISKFDTPYISIEDRGEAIQHAIDSVTKKTLIVVTGKGHETTQKIDGKYYDIPTDIEQVDRLMKEYDEKHPANH